MELLKLLPRRYYVVDGVTYLVTNLSATFNVSSTLLTTEALFLKYVIKDGETPRDLAERLYDNRDLYWTIFIFNGLTNTVNDWPMHSGDLYDQAVRLWGYDKVDEVVNYSDDSGNLVDLNGVRFQYGLTDSTPDDQTVITTYNLKPVTRYDLLEMENESKRNIKLLDPRYMDQFLASVRKELQ